MRSFNPHAKLSHHKMSTKYHQRGWAHFMRKEFDDCLLAWRKAIMIREAYLGTQDNATKESGDLILTVLSRMGLSGRECKQYLKILRKSIKHEANGDAHAWDGAKKKALQEYCKALKLEEKLVGKEHHMITATLHRKIASMNINVDESSCDTSILLFCDTLAGDFQ